MTDNELAVARATFVALLRSGGTLHTFSLALLVAGAVLVSGGAAGKTVAALVAVSALSALPALLFAVRVRLDAELLTKLEGLEDGLPGGVAAVREMAPAGLGSRVSMPVPADPLDAYRRSARLLFRQAAFTTLQGILYVAAVIARAL